MMPKKPRPDGYYERRFDELHDEGRIKKPQKVPLDKSFRNANGCVISYEDVIKACEGELFKVKLSPDEGKIVEKAVNIGIDAHLEACFVPDRGDLFEWQHLKGGRVRLFCVVSPESLPVLIRRLFDKDDTSDIAGSLLTSLGFDEEGKTSAP